MGTGFGPDCANTAEDVRRITAESQQKTFRTGRCDDIITILLTDVRLTEPGSERFCHVEGSNEWHLRSTVSRGALSPSRSKPVGSALRFVPWKTSPSAGGLTVRRRLGFGRTPVKHRFGNEAK